MAEKLHDLGREVKPSRIKLVTKTKPDRLLIYGINGHITLEIALICKKEDENDG